MKAGKTVRWIQILGDSKSSIEGSKKIADKNDEDDDDEIIEIFKKIAEFAKNNKLSNYDGTVIENYSKNKSCLPSKYIGKFK